MAKHFKILTDGQGKVTGIEPAYHDGRGWFILRTTDHSTDPFEPPTGAGGLGHHACDLPAAMSAAIEAYLHENAAAQTWLGHGWDAWHFEQRYESRDPQRARAHHLR
jgi:hypothetical protein